MEIAYENSLPLENGFLCQLSNFQEINEDIFKIKVIYSCKWSLIKIDNGIAYKLQSMTILTTPGESNEL